MQPLAAIVEAVRDLELPVGSERESGDDKANPDGEQRDTTKESRTLFSPQLVAVRPRTSTRARAGLRHNRVNVWPSAAVCRGQ